MKLSVKGIRMRKIKDHFQTLFPSQMQSLALMNEVPLDRYNDCAASDFVSHSFVLVIMIMN